MSPELIQRLIKLVQQHGDKIVLSDPSVGRAVVVLDLEAYEKLRETSPEPLVALEERSRAVLASTASPAPQATSIQPQAVSNLQPEPLKYSNTQILNHSANQITEPPSAPETPKNSQPQPKTTPETIVSPDLTQEQLIDKINRDIGAWKIAQDRKRSAVLKSAVAPAPAAPVAQTPAFEEEERFYLEPIE